MMLHNADKKIRLVKIYYDDESVTGFRFYDSNDDLIYKIGRLNEYYDTNSVNKDSMEEEFEELEDIIYNWKHKKIKIEEGELILGVVAKLSTD